MFLAYQRLLLSSHHVIKSTYHSCQYGFQAFLLLWILGLGQFGLEVGYFRLLVIIDKPI